jgi:hypothetical protein
LFSYFLKRVSCLCLDQPGRSVSKGTVMRGSWRGEALTWGELRCKTEFGKGKVQCWWPCPICPEKMSKNKAPSLRGQKASDYRSCSQAACRQATFKTEQPGGFEKSQPRKLWDSQAQFPHGDCHQRWTQRRGFDRGNMKSKKRLRGWQPHLIQ